MKVSSLVISEYLNTPSILLYFSRSYSFYHASTFKYHTENEKFEHLNLRDTKKKNLPHLFLLLVIF